MTQETRINLVGFSTLLAIIIVILTGFYYGLIRPENNFETAVAQMLKVEEKCDEVWQQSISYFCLKGDAVKEFHFSHHTTSVQNIQKEYDCKYGKDRKPHNRFVELKPDKTICYNLMAEFRDNRS